MRPPVGPDGTGCDRSPSRDRQGAMEFGSSSRCQVRSEKMKYAVIYEKTATGYSAYVPDLPGCVAAAATLEETEDLMRGAIEMHLASMREDGDPIPAPTTLADYIAVFA
jgi:predicted RNase H-like HicB family nuclease